VEVKYIVSPTHVKRRKLLIARKIDVIVLDSPQFTRDKWFDFVPLGLHINRQLFINKAHHSYFIAEGPGQQDNITNGKAERFIQTSIKEWTYKRPY